MDSLLMWLRESSIFEFICLPSAGVWLVRRRRVLTCLREVAGKMRYAKENPIEAAGLKCRGQSANRKSPVRAGGIRQYAPVWRAVPARAPVYDPTWPGLARESGCPGGARRRNDREGKGHKRMPPRVAEIQNPAPFPPGLPEEC